MLSQRATAIAPSATLAISDKAKELRRAGIDVADFSIGEPDFDTPQHIKQAAIRAIQQGFTKYTAPAGTAELKEAVCRKLEKENGLSYGASQVAVSCGAKHSLYNIFLALLNRGDEVVVPSPYWTSYPEQIRLAGGKPVFAATDKQFHAVPKQVKTKLTKRTKAIVVNSPSNPTGAVERRETIMELASLAEKRGVWLISDEIYEHFVYDGRKQSGPASFAYDNTIVVNGVSKTYAMTGWRIGYCAGPAAIVKAVADIQSQTTSNPSSIAQAAAVEALAGDQSPVRTMIAEFDRRRKYMTTRLQKMGLSCRLPEGAFYVFPEVPDKMSSSAFAALLLDKARVAVVPGKDFGSDRHVRLSYATGMKTIEAGMDRVERVLRGLR